jgi:hypothetical protein
VAAGEEDAAAAGEHGRCPFSLLALLSGVQSAQI